MSVPTLVRRVQNIFDDIQQDWCDTDLVIRWLSMHSEELELNLQAMSLDYDEQIIVLPAVPALTTNLAAYLGEGQLLSGLITPTLLEWRPAGTSDQQWETVSRQDKLTDTQTNTGTNPPASQDQSIESYTWRNRTIYISPANRAVDMRLTGEFLPPVINSDADEYLVGALVVLSYRVAEGISVGTRGGANTQISAWLKAKGDAAYDDFMRVQILADQSVRRRIGGRRSTVWFPNWQPPLG